MFLVLCLVDDEERVDVDRPDVVTLVERFVLEERTPAFDDPPMIELIFPRVVFIFLSKNDDPNALRDVEFSPPTSIPGLFKAPDLLSGLTLFCGIRLYIALDLTLYCEEALIRTSGISRAGWETEYLGTTLVPEADNASSLLLSRLFGFGRVPEEGLLPEDGLLGVLLTPPLDPLRVGGVLLTSGFLVPDGRAEEPRLVDGVRTPDVLVVVRPFSVIVPRSRVVVVPLVTPLVRPEFSIDRSPLLTTLPRSVN